MVTLTIMDKEEKKKRYEEVLGSIKNMIEGEDDLMAVLSTISCELYHAFEHWNWVGFYRRTDARTLKVGPYQGGHGCLTIDIDRGVCGASVREKSIMMIRDVSTVDNHIVCDSKTKSEMVLPIVGSPGTVLAIFDLDSTELGAFDQTDKEYLSKLVDWIRPLYDRDASRFVDENQSGGGTNFSI